MKTCNYYIHLCQTRNDPFFLKKDLEDAPKAPALLKALILFCPLYTTLHFPYLCTVGTVL